MAVHPPSRDDGPTRSRPRIRAVEWPSVALCAGVYGSFLALTFWHARLPPFALAALLAPLLALQGSMQHEFIHGHPTPWRRLNRAMAAVPLSLWLPFESYRRSHLLHHRDESLTDPFDDPESHYWSPEAWARIGPLGRGLVRFNTTLAGRLLLGPAVTVTRYLLAEARALRHGERGARRIWSGHAVGAAAVLAWVMGLCGLDPLFYLFGVVYPSTSILLLRSFAEHRAAAGVAERTAIVENAPVFGFLFLFNNLHAAHHERPLVPWYALPSWYRANRARLLAGNGALVYDGYGDVARRYLFTPHDVSVHPTLGDRALLPSGTIGSHPGLPGWDPGARSRRSRDEGRIRETPLVSGTDRPSVMGLVPDCPQGQNGGPPPSRRDMGIR